MSSVDSKTEGSTSWKLKEENAAHQLQIRRLRDTIMSGKQSSAEESLEQVMKSPMLQSLPLTEVTPALFKYSRLPSIANEQKFITNLPKICDGATMSPWTCLLSPGKPRTWRVWTPACMSSWKTT
ncbi:hypothetical protein DPEC_G00109140 [Dallia pectoralis]|uniref:Uncharacterized protein n=2 Tax=Dallia pectoralis TaxID=75939 RepID=A0ACC2GRY5_DALPE|nr:hypothetical protein DPEC_G00107250 [Dallia pectoralis]KAJ8006621.1 hypothetical protein DPEC_G00109140 [Dallia pectoralis]